MSQLTRGEFRSLHDLLEWLESPLTTLHVFAPQAMRIEDFLSDDRYVVRAELPGMSPERDIELTMSSGVLTIRAERREEGDNKSHSEFRYGSFVRRVRMPDGIDEKQIQATYDNGILEVAVKLNGTHGTPAHRIPIRHLDHIKPM